MKKKSLKERVEEYLKTGWYSNFQINMYFKSSSADRIMRFIRKNPPSGWVVSQRPKEIDGYTKCLEYRLVTLEI